MRIQLKLKVAKDFSYDTKYYSKFQGFIYKQLVDTPYRFLHEKKRYKFFCFSNIFPLKINKKTQKVEDFKEDQTKFWLVSSPDKAFVYILLKKLEELKKQNKVINLGEMSFYLDGIKVIKRRIKSKGVKIKAETPIILRISKRWKHKCKGKQCKK